jgi:hypothetical protein
MEEVEEVDYVAEAERAYRWASKSPDDPTLVVGWAEQVPQALTEARDASLLGIGQQLRRIADILERDQLDRFARETYA